MADTAEEDFVQYCVAIALESGLVDFKDGDRDFVRLTRKGLTVAPVIAILIDVLATELQTMNLMLDKEFDGSVKAMAVAKILEMPEYAKVALKLLSPS